LGAQVKISLGGEIEIHPGGVVIVFRIAPQTLRFADILTLINQVDAKGAVQKRHLTQTLRQSSEVEIEVVKNLQVGPEVSGRSAAPVTLADLLKIGDRHATGVFLPETMTIAADFNGQPFRESIDDADSHSV
jgi:hypothetical protein